MLCLLVIAPAWAQPSALEKAVVDEINQLRTNPRQFAQRLRDQRANYHGLVFQRPGGRSYKLHEGLAALEEAVLALESQSPCGSLEISPGLGRAARDHARDQGRSGATKEWERTLLSVSPTHSTL